MQRILSQNEQKTLANTPHNYYNLEKRLIVQKCPLFKMKLFAQDSIIFTAPDSRSIVTVDLNLNAIQNVYQYKNRPLALDWIQLNNQKFVIVGCQNGQVIVTSKKQIQKYSQKENKKLGQKKKNKEKSQQQMQQWVFKPQSSNERFINQIVHLQKNPTVIVNCYNNGDIAIWGLLSKKRIHTLKNVHDSYTYKLRFQQQSKLLSCGHDSSVVRTDLQKLKPISNFSHPNAVWCVHPTSQNEFASVGRFGRTLVWDIRSKRVVQACNNNYHQTSYLTERNPSSLELFYGDLQQLMKWDRRTLKPQRISKYSMITSVQSMLFHKQRMYVCGRGKQLCVLQGSDSVQSINNFKKILSTRVIKLNKGYASQVSQIQNQLSEQEQEQSQEQQQLQEQQLIEQIIDMVDQQSQALLKSPQRNVVQKVNLCNVAKLSIQQQMLFRQKQESILEYSQYYSQIESDNTSKQSQQQGIQIQEKLDKNSKQKQEQSKILIIQNESQNNFN